MSEPKPLPPSPGSREALAVGCTCAVLDNAHGRGYMGQPGVFVMTTDCPLHGFPKHKDHINEPA